MVESISKKLCNIFILFIYWSISVLFIVMIISSYYFVCY